MTYGGTGRYSNPAAAPSADAILNPAAKFHKDPTGLPCLSFKGLARPQRINANVIDHVIKTNNRCSSIIRVDICYYKSTRCVTEQIPPYAQKETILGIMPNVKDFRFEYKEKFL